MNLKRKLALAALLGAGVGLTGCQSPSSGGMAFWKKDGNSDFASASPDVGKQKYDGLAKEFGKPPARTGLGGQQAAADENFLTASWKKTTGAVSGAFTPKSSGADAADPLRLDQPTRKMGPEVHVGAAQLLENQSKWVEAEAQYQKALKLAPNDLSTLIGLARLHDRQGHTQQALEFYHQAVKAHPTSAMAFNDLGLCYNRQRQSDSALAAMSRAVELSPNNPKYRNNLAAVLVETGRVDEAVQKLSQGAAPAVAHYNVGYLLQQRGQSENAARQIQQALALDPGLTPARDLLAQLSGGNAIAQSPAPPAAQPAAAAPAYQTAQRPARHVAAPAYEVPQVDVPAQAAAPPAPSGPAGYHLTDEAAPAAETPAAASKWGNYATQHLPPVE